jgi:hypothetical protein
MSDTVAIASTTKDERKNVSVNGASSKASSSASSSAKNIKGNTKGNNTKGNTKKSYSSTFNLDNINPDKFNPLLFSWWNATRAEDTELSPIIFNENNQIVSGLTAEDVERLNQIIPIFLNPPNKVGKNGRTKNNVEVNKIFPNTNNRVTTIRFHCSALSEICGYFTRCCHDGLKIRFIGFAVRFAVNVPRNVNMYYLIVHPLDYGKLADLLKKTPSLKNRIFKQWVNEGDDTDPDKCIYWLKLHKGNISFISTCKEHYNTDSPVDRLGKDNLAIDHNVCMTDGCMNITRNDERVFKKCEECVEPDES